jgi:hypothetical protein
MKPERDLEVNEWVTWTLILIFGAIYAALFSLVLWLAWKALH